ncbi:MULTISPECIES: phosphatase PAP2 family protein [Acinetobacter]|uniref:undecaprenyl-diphosphate phosphatase n=1 Tax=Acinetobacter chengduensis TaxID=2420890 RepID=A0ABX9TZ99_9GAMM|nr:MULTISPECIES: phosphatase PAP2 family protein [Acinetobacter]RKG43604.1 phosphatase PAP2 family protein [Acinetobacter sp. WCHAc060007]RLL23993.1 phosphatase PAP2 family protein [Acinetobacter chengduensis]
MPKRLLFLGCFLLLISMFLLKIPALNVFDLGAVQWMFKHRSHTINSIAIGLSIAGGMPFVLFITTLWCLTMAWYKKYINIVFISIGIFGSIVLTWVLKYFISRPRPPEMYFLVKTYGDSFPSGHSLYAATLGCLAMYVYLKHSHHKLICLAMSLWVFVMGISRVYAGAHYPSDVLSGWSISFIWITLLYLAISKYQSANKE